MVQQVKRKGRQREQSATFLRQENIEAVVQSSDNQRAANHRNDEFSIVQTDQRTRARKTDTGWVINGAKMWISMGNYARARADLRPDGPVAGATRGSRCFLVDTEQDGLQNRRRSSTRWGCTPQTRRRSPLEDVEVGEDGMLGTVGEGFKVAMSALDSGRYSVAAGCVGICRGCVEESVKYVTEREQFGRADRELPARAGDDRRHGVEDRCLADARLARRVAEGKGRPNTLETSVAKLHATEAAVECANTAIQVHGGAGYVDDHRVERYFRDVRVTTL